MHHHHKPTFRVEFTEPGVEDKADLDSALDEVAKQAGFNSPSECLEIKRFKMKDSTRTHKRVGLAEIAVCKGCPEMFLSLFQQAPVFTTVHIVPTP